MIKLTKNIVIAAPPEKVFDLVNDVDNLPILWKNLSNIRNLTRLPNGGHNFKFDYIMIGIRVQGSSTDLEYVRPRRVVVRTTGGVISTMTWEFRALEGGTKTDMFLEIRYEVPVPVVGKLAEVIIAKINESDIVYMLNYVKLELEARR